MARRMGLGGRIPNVPSVVLGSAEVTPIELTAAYAAFANLGERPQPRLVTRVVDRNNNVVWSSDVVRERVINPTTAFMTTSLMQDVVDRGTATGVRGAGYARPAAGKTGTTNDAADIWFIGFTPTMVGTIWMGFDKRKTILRGATGGELAAPVWGRIMRRMNIESNGWAPPNGVEMRMVDEYGNVVGDNCPIIGPTRQEYFIEGTAPFTSCYSGSYTYMDTTMYGDSVIRAPIDDDDRWWQRLRSRIFGNEDTPAEPSPPPPPAREEPPLGEPYRPRPTPTPQPTPQPTPVPVPPPAPPDTTEPEPEPTDSVSTEQ
jgi:penicillin-binding protein 1A